MRKLASLLTALTLLALSAPAAATRERPLQIRPDVGIGRIKLGMTLKQVRRVLGPSQLLNRRVKVGFGREHREYVWNWFEWTVAFRGTPGKFRAVRVVTSLRRHRYRGIGVGSRVRAVIRVFPQARCRAFLAGGQQIIAHTSGGRELRFVVHPGRNRGRLDPMYVDEVIVQDPLGPHGYTLRVRSVLPPFGVYVNPGSPCLPDWRRR